jgi:hypothetical protein
MTIRKAALVIALALAASACTSTTNIEAEPGRSTTASTENETNDDQENSVSNEDESDIEANPTPTTAILTESSLSETSAPLVTSPDDVEPKAPAGPAALSAVLLAAIDGFEPVTATDADRALAINDAASLQPDPTEELPLLETRGYQGGWTRAFRNADNDVIITTVYDFISALEADFYLEDGTITLIGDGGTIYEVGAIPGARGFRQDVSDGGEPLVVFGITFTRGNQWFLVTIVGDPATATPERLLPAASAQFAAAMEFNP